MQQKRFRVIDSIMGWLVFAIATTVYCLTAEPTASLWDCSEFIISAYKLEIGHPPGAPFFMLTANLFTQFASDPSQVALMVNIMSGLLSAGCVMFLYWTVSRLMGRLLGGYAVVERVQDIVLIEGAALVGALVCMFSDSFWYSAVEAEVYAYSSFLTALVFWMILKWEEEADGPGANRWLLLISYFIGLSIGVHLLNLLCIPAMVLVFYFRRTARATTWGICKALLISFALLGGVLYGLIPVVLWLAGLVELLAVNILSLPFNSGLVVFVFLLSLLIAWGMWRLQGTRRLVLCCVAMILVGFSCYAVILVRSAANPPMDENSPEDVFALKRYLNREQYEDHPLFYGPAYNAKPRYERKGNYMVAERKEGETIWSKSEELGKYVDEGNKIEYVYEDNMLFPRMHSARHAKAYEQWMGGVKGPTMKENIGFFVSYQLYFMYIRYFMWNFAGRQNDIHSPSPGDIFAGNWESGIPFIDNIRLGDQSDAPDYLLNNKAKNHYFMLPLLLGLLGLFFQFDRDKRGCWLTFLMFFMTGIAVVIYLNQPPYQVRERDYAYAGSFYSFSIWIGLAVAALYSWITRGCKAESKGKYCGAITASAVTAVCLGVPALMAAENWDDHDRSNRYTAVEMAKNYLNSVGQNGILITHGDNDTFPLWYAQEVENIRPDVRICNTSLLGTDWHIDQMKYAVNESAPLDLQVGPRQYLYGTNEYVYIYDTRDTIVPLADVMRVFRHPDAKLPLQSGRSVDYILSRKFSIPVNKENIIKYGILDEKYSDMIPDEIVLSIPKDKDYLTKPEIFMLDLLSNYQWDRPISLLSMGGDINIGQKDYLMYDGFSYRFVPIKNRMKSTDIGFADAEDLYNKIKNVYTWDALKRTDYFVDYQNFYTFCGVLSQRQIFVNAAWEMLKIGDKERAIELLDMCQECVPEENYPLDITYLGFINEYMVIGMAEAYYAAGASDKAEDLLRRMVDPLMKSLTFFGSYSDYASQEFEKVYTYLENIAQVASDGGSKELVDELVARFEELSR